MNYLIKDASIVNENNIAYADVLVKDGRIEKISSNINVKINVEEINAKGLQIGRAHV